MIRLPVMVFTVVVSAITAASADDRMLARAQAASEAGAAGWSASAGASFLSDYVFRGITLSDRKPSPQGYGELRYDIAYAGLSAAKVRFPTGANIELTSVIGINPTIGPFKLDLGATYYSYPGNEGTIDYAEYFANAVYTRDSLTLGSKLYVAPNYSNTGARGVATSLLAKYALTGELTLGGEIGRSLFFGITNEPNGSIKLPDYTYWNIGLSYAQGPMTFELRYHDTDLSQLDCNLLTGDAPAGLGSKGCSRTLVGSVSFDVSLGKEK